MQRTVVLVVLDGWGLGEDNESNPIYRVSPPTFKRLAEEYPVTSLQASGISVGLPWGEVGNSEVGHLTIGAGKVIYQHYPRITLAIRDGSFFENPVLKAASEHAKKNNSALNFVGLLTKANVHASLEHLEALIEFAKREGIPRVKLHLFADGKDSPPKTLESFLAHVPRELLATLMGRYYAMDREQNWSLTQDAYQCLVSGGGTRVDDASFKNVLQRTYDKGLTEEYLPILRFGGDEMNIHDAEAVIFFNYREDSIRQIAESFTNPAFDKFPRVPLNDLFIGSFTPYKKEWTLPVAFPPETINHPLSRILSEAGKTQLRLAETYKYAHVTYFFNGFQEAPFKNEYRVLIPSNPAPHPEEHPELMARAITERLTEALAERAYDFILVNYANPDTIGHTGNYAAAQSAVRIMDEEIAKVATLARDSNAILLITADHGNLEEMIDPKTGTIETQHDPNPVPFFLIAEEFKGKHFSNWPRLRNETLGILSDIAPTILELLGLPASNEMTGKSILRDLR